MGFSEKASKFQIALLVNGLCESKSFSALTVNDICREAGISRATFYRMFEDKYSLNNWCQAFNFAAGILQIGRTYTWADGLYVAYSCAEFFGNLARASYEARGDRSNVAFCRRCFRACLADTIKNVRHEPLMDDLRFETGFFADAVAWAASDYWTRGCGGETLRSYADRLARCVPPLLFRTLNDPVDPRPPISIDAVSLAKVAQTMDEELLLGMGGV